MENVNGRKLVEAGDLCERRNGIAIYLACLIMEIDPIVKYQEYQFQTFFWQEEELILIVIGAWIGARKRRFVL